MKSKLNKRKKIIIYIFTASITLFLSFIISCIITMIMYSPTFLGRVITHFDSSITDYKIFPERSIKKSIQPYMYTKNIDSNIADINITHLGKESILSKFIEITDTTSFIIVKNDQIIYEQYAACYSEDSINTSFSMAKSIVSLLIGKAIENGYIKSVKEPIENYIIEFKDKEIGKTTIEQLLLMKSNITYDEEKFLWFGDDTLTYFYDSLRELAIKHTKLTNKYNGKFHYNNYHPLLLGLILERCTGLSVSTFFEREIWQKIGTCNDASWSLDSNKSGFEKMESGINFRSIDFIKIGSMILHDGYWNNQQVINSGYLKLSTKSDSLINNEEYENSFLYNKNIGYKYMWYYTPSNKTEYDIFAWGKSDQILYISKENDLVILRTGKTDGKVLDWIEVIKKIINNIE